MPADLEELRRQLDAEPDNAELRRGYEAALARAGREGELSESLAFRFQCSLSWSDLDTGSDRRERRCETCKESVYAVADLEELTERAREGQCIAAPSAMLTAYARILASARGAGEGEGGEPGCVVNLAEDLHCDLMGPPMMKMGKPAPPPGFWDDEPPAAPPDPAANRTMGRPLEPPPIGFLGRILRRLRGD